MADNVVSSLLNGVSYFFDALTYIPYKFTSGSQVSERLRRSHEVRVSWKVCSQCNSLIIIFLLY